MAHTFNTSPFNTNDDPHQAFELQLPWYLNGSLPPAETVEVEAHLSECAQCRALLASEESLAQSVKAIDIGRDQAWAAMERRIAVAPPSRGAWYRRPVSLGWALASPLLAASLIAAVMIAPRALPVRETLYVAQGAPATERGGNIIILFRDDASAVHIRDVVNGVHARVVDGPTVTGAWLAHVTPATRTDALRQLAADPAVQLAQPIDPGGQP